MRLIPALVVTGMLMGAGLVFDLEARAGAAPVQDDELAAQGNTSSLHPRKKTYMRREWGIEIVFVRQTSAGYMLEFRYKVIDPEKALPLFERQAKPVLTHAETGAQMVVPTPAKTGALRNSNLPRAGNTYWMFFANPGKLVEPGDEIAIEIGEFRVAGLVVE
jgi:hypothetical protein